MNELTRGQQNNLAILASYPDMKIINYHGDKAYNFYDWGKQEMGKNINPKHVECFIEKGFIEQEIWTMRYQTYRINKLGKQTYAEQFKPNLDTLQAENAALRERVTLLEAALRDWLENPSASKSPTFYKELFGGILARKTLQVLEEESGAAVNPGAITNIAKQLLETGGPGEG